MSFVRAPSTFAFLVLICGRPGCDATTGYSPKYVNGIKVCVQKAVDPSSCGAGQGVVCPLGYGSTGTATCFNGVCGICASSRCTSRSFLFC